MPSNRRDTISHYPITTAKKINKRAGQ
jgi:hypothetical protein